jgi:hypothetical protein
MQSEELEGSPREQVQQISSSEITSTSLFRTRFFKEIRNYWEFFTLLFFLIGLGGGYLIGIRDLSSGYGNRVEESLSTQEDGNLAAQLIEQIHPPGGYSLEVEFGDIGPQLLAADAVDYDVFIKVYEKAGQPLNEEQLAILADGSDAKIVFDRENAYFLLNFFWALGLTNENPILTDGPMVQYSEGQIERFASTGGWSISSKPVTDLYASAQILPLSAEQLQRVENVAKGVYRPCCNNPTIFPDCNHGMAMLGMLELLAFNDASEDQMFEAAKYANAFWFPQQTLEIAMFHKTGQKLDFSELEPRLVVGPKISSGSGFQVVHQWLTENGVLADSSGSGSSCGV